jgi:hypothetical protein
MKIKDRRKPWQKKLQNMKIARCGSMLAENARGWGSALTEWEKDANRRGRYGAEASDREVQYWLHLTGQDVPHRTAFMARRPYPTDIDQIDRRAVYLDLQTRGLVQ